MTPLFSLREKRILRYVIFFVIVSRVLLMFRSEERIYSRPYLEDSYYLDNCASHFASGEGFTCDGKQPTNGVQPLIVVLYAPLFLIAGADKLLALKLGFILIALFDSLSVIFIACLVRTLQRKPHVETSPWKSPPVIAAILWAGLYPIFVHTGGGLETGLYSTMLLAVLYYYAKISRTRSEGGTIRIGKWILLGVLLGITVLARVDAVFLVLALAGFEFYKFKAKGFVTGAIISIPAFIVSSPWWWYNEKFFGSLMPQSGASESLGSMIGENMLRGASVITDIFTVFFFSPYYDLPVWAIYILILAVTGIVFWSIRKFKLPAFLKKEFELSSLSPYFFFCGALAIYYIFFFSAPHFLPRYFHPFRILWLVLFACVALKLFQIRREFHNMSKSIATAMICIFTFCAIAFSLWSYLHYFTISKQNDFYLTGKFALQHPSERIGMEQSGTSGFIASNILNLDGKVNLGALHAMQSGDIGAYIESEKLDYIADWREISEPMVASAARHGGNFREVDNIGRVIIFKREK
ncbi:MAG: hypothetical protein ACHQM6_06120 [Candidatus Kapaibacterium sp.]